MQIGRRFAPAQTQRRRQTDRLHEIWISDIGPQPNHANVVLFISTGFVVGGVNDRLVNAHVNHWVGTIIFDAIDCLTNIEFAKTNIIPAMKSVKK